VRTHTATRIRMNTEPIAEQSLAALLHLSSPALPLGAFSYSQGLEAAVEAKDVRDEMTARGWVEDGLLHGFGRCELPVLALQYDAWSRHASEELKQRDAWFRASRETCELLAETEQMGWAAVQLARDLGVAATPLAAMRPVALPTAMAFLACAQGVPSAMALIGYAFTWLENHATAAGKSVPLGQGAVQRIVFALRGTAVQQARRALGMKDDDLETFAPRLALRSAQHETQYTRLFRS
jgi:urease accessory protein